MKIFRDWIRGLKFNGNDTNQESGHKNDLVFVDCLHLTNTNRFFIYIVLLSIRIDIDFVLGHLIAENQGWIVSGGTLSGWLEVVG